MRKGTKVLALMLVILAGVYALAADAPKDYGVGQTHSIELNEAANVGNVLLRAGTYRVTHIMDGANHVLVFRNGSKKELARVNCTMVDLPQKSNRTMQEFVTKGSERVLTGVTFSGEKYKHQF